jgi:hypothetical protein
MAGELLELVTADPRLRYRIAARVHQVISDSFAADKSRVTASEAKRRFGIVEQLIRELRADYGWAFERILDAMPIALRCKLDGAPWTPDLRRNSWAGSGQKL